MGLRETLTEEVKLSMKAGTAARTSTLRMVMAKLKDSDIASRPKGIDQIPEEDIVAMLRGMVKSRRESVELYTQGNRPELAAKEQAEIEVIEGFLPRALNEEEMQAAVKDAVAETGAAGVKDMGRVMAVLKTKYGAALDMARIGAIVKLALAG